MPSKNDLLFSDEQFRYALRDYLSIRVAPLYHRYRITPGAVSCADFCVSQDPLYLLSNFHLRTCRACGNKQTGHNCMRDMLAACLRLLGYYCEVEPRGPSHGFNVNTGVDIAFFLKRRKIYIDVGLADTSRVDHLEGAGSTFFFNGKARHEEKVIKYASTITARGHEFHPIIFESGGAMDGSLEKILKRAAKWAPEALKESYSYHWSSPTLVHYLLKRISAFFWKQKYQLIVSVLIYFKYIPSNHIIS